MTEKAKLRLKSTVGVSLGEMLVAVLIMSFLTLAVSAGVGTAAKVYRSEKEYSESRVLANSILLAMTEELRYAAGLDTAADGSEAHYDSAAYGYGTVMKIDEEGEQAGKLVLLYGGGKVSYPYEEKTYMDYRLQTHGDQPLFQLTDGGTCVELSYDICDSAGNVKASLENVKIRLLNGQSMTISARFVSDYKKFTVDFLKDHPTKGNDQIRAAFLEKYNGKWPTLTVAGESYSIQPFYQGKDKKKPVEECVWLFARKDGSAASGWNVPYVYVGGKWYGATNWNGTPGGSANINYDDVTALREAVKNKKHSSGKNQWVEIKDYTESN